MFDKFWAKSDGTSLWNHLCDVRNKTLELLDEAGLTNDTVRRMAELASIFHDIGKTMPVYQDFIRKTDEDQCKFPYTDKYPRHNEVSATLFKALKICPLDSNIENVISAAIQFHHTCTGSNALLSDLYTEEEIREVCDFIKEFCHEYNVKILDIELDDERTETVMEHRVMPSSQFDFINDDDIDADKIRYLGYYKTIFDVVRYADLIVSGEKSHSLLRPNSSITDRNFTLPDSYDSDRWEEQSSTIERLHEFNYCILKATMGYGKTLCGLKHLLKSDRVGAWVCPDNSVAQATYDNIARTLEICGMQNIKVSLLLNGQWVHGSDIADIIVTNIDTFENGTFRNNRKDISFKFLFANAIFDEYHEYLMDDNPLSCLFLSAIDARKKMKNVRTLLMSGTIANGKKFLNFEENRIIIADDSGMERRKKIRIHYLPPKEVIPAFSGKKNYFIVYSAIKNCQDAYGKIGDMCLHSRFDENDMMSKNNTLFLGNGKGMHGHENSVVSTSTISRAYDLSFSSAVLINPNPYQILQTTGRINRWEYNNRIGDLYIVVDEEPIAKGIYLSRENSRLPKNSMSKKIAYTLWEDVYRPYIQEMMKRFKEGENVTIAKLHKFMNEYFENNKTIKRIADVTLMNSFRKLKMIEFRKGTAIGDGKERNKFISDKTDVRGDNMNRFVCVQIEGEVFGTMSGVMSMPSYAFGNNGFDALDESATLYDVLKYFALNREIAAKYFGNTSLERKLKSYGKNPRKLHTVLLKNALSSETPYPVFGKYMYSHDIGFFKKN